MNTKMNKKKEFANAEKKINIWAIDIVDFLSLGGQFL